VPGRLDRLFVDYTGMGIRKGDHLVEIYSPELLAAQEELIQAVQSDLALRKSDLAIMRSTSRANVDAAREKLILWGLSPAQVRRIEERGETMDRLTIHAPLGGIVVKKHALEGQYVRTGTPIYTIADLSRLWVKLDAYESDLTWIRLGQGVTFEAQAYSGQTFKGRIAFIHPLLNVRTRTVKVRVNVDNADAKLKPGMFVRALVHSQVALGGRVLEPDLIGKWMCPMHPEIVKDEKGQCDYCGMALVTATSLGFRPAEKEPQAPLVIPATAPLITGERAVVYVEVPDAKRPTYEGREVVLGPRAGHYYLVNSGLKQGERVVTRGAFKIDSALQIQGKPSMMSPRTTAMAAPPEFLGQLEPVYAAYFAVQQALFKDDIESARRAFGDLVRGLDGVDVALLQGRGLLLRRSRPHEAWMPLAPRLKEAAEAGQKAADLNAARKHFGDASAVALELEKVFGHGGEATHYKAFCPMAFGSKGMHWLQAADTIQNPFMGSMMPRCGTIKRTFPPAYASAEEETPERAPKGHAGH